MLKPGVHAILVSPTGDHDQVEHGRLVVVQNEVPQRKVWRGVVLAVGAHVMAEIKPGDVAHYSQYVELADETVTPKHVVPENYLLAWDGDDE
jgi:hypothetical protein